MLSLGGKETTRKFLLQSSPTHSFQLWGCWISLWDWLWRADLSPMCWHCDVKE